MGPHQLSRGAAAALVAVAGLSACARSSSARVDRGGVTVASRLIGRGGSTRVVTTFKPDRPGFHLYGLSLPQGGVDGLGIRTEVAAGEGWMHLSAPAPSQSEQRLRIDALAVELPVFPDGPVELTQDAVAAPGRHALTVLVSYGACSSAVCLVPVRDLVVRVTGA